MKNLIIFIFVFLITGALFAQDNLSVVTEIDYYNATRYTGGRNIARTTDGYVIVVYEPGSGYSNQEIWYAIYNSAFGSWDVAQLSNSSQGATGTPAITADETGKLFAAWKEKNADGKRDAMFSTCTFVDEFTHTWSAPIPGDNIDNNSGVCTIETDDSNNPFIMFSIWNDPAIFDANIYVSKTTDMGATWSTDNLTSEFPTPDYLPFNFMDVNLAKGKNGVMYASWEDKPQPITTQYEVLFSEYSPASSSWSTPVVLTPVNDGEPRLQHYVDGMTLISGASSIYEMGPINYVFAGKTSVAYYDNGTSKVMSAFFNPYYFEPVEQKDQYIADVVNYFGISSSDSILVVDDDNKYNNEWVITDALDQMDVQYRVFDCGNNSGMAENIPTAADLNDKQLVIWFTGDDSNNLAFWNIADEDNPALKDYLNQMNSKLFVIGRDFIYDRYGGAADTFSVGDFCYDYLGLQSYDVQSWKDDDNSGVSQLDLVSGNSAGFSSVEAIGWGNGGIRQGEPTIAGDPSGNVHLAYLDAAGDHIMYQKYDGAIWSEPVQIDNTPDTVNVQRPNIAVDPNYGVYVTWMQETDRTGDGTLIYNVVYATSPDGGANWNEPVQMSNVTEVNASNYSVKNPTLGKKVRKAIDGVFDGGAEVIWTEANAGSSMGYYIMYGRIPYVGTITDVKSDKVEKMDFSLAQNYPNPFNPTTTIKFSIPETSGVRLEIFNSLGQSVALLANERMTAGEHLKVWNASEFPSGVYFAELTSGGRKDVRKMMLLK